MFSELRGRFFAHAMLLAACGPSISPEAHLERERSFLRLGVELAREDDAVRHVLAQRHLTVAAEVRGSIFIALGASTFDERLSAIRVISPRGVIVAEDAARDDLFAPAQLRLLDRFPPTFGEYFFVAWTRTPLGRDLGCVSLARILPDGSAVPAVLDVGMLGPRACVADLSRALTGELVAQVAFPGLFGGQTPSIFVELVFQSVPLGREAPLIPVAKIAPAGPWLEAERARVEGTTRGEAPFEERHAAGVARPGGSVARRLEHRGPGRGLPQHRGAGDARVQRRGDGRGHADHLEHGWADPGEGETPVDGQPHTGPGEGDILIDPEQIAGDAGLATEAPNGPSPSDDAVIIEPKAKP